MIAAPSATAPIAATASSTPRRFFFVPLGFGRDALFAMGDLIRSVDAQRERGWF